MSLTFLNNFNQGDTNGYGPLSVNIPNTTGNALMVVVGVGSDNTAGYLPRTYVADNAHNWWILAGSETSIFAGANRRVDLWIAPNATKADTSLGTYISVGSSSPYAGMCAMGLEISGFPTYAQPDFVGAGGGFGTSVNLTGTATVADYVFGAALISGAGNPSFVITPPAGWTSFPGGGTNSLGTDMSSQIVQLSWNTISPGAVSATWSWTGSQNNLAVMVGFKQSPTAPSQPNANWPSVKVEAAFGFSPGNLTGALPTWTDITSRAQDNEGQVVAKFKAGRDFELSQPAAGEYSIQFDNHDSAFNPLNSGSPYFPNVQPEVPIRASAVWNGRQYGLGYIYAGQWPQQFPNPQWGMTTMQGSDVIGLVSQGQLPSALGGQILADNPYCYYPLSDYYASPHFAQFANLSRTNLKPAIGFSQGGASALLSTGQTLGLLGDGGTGIGTTGLSQPTTADAGCGVFVRDFALPDLGPTTVTLELWAQVPVVAGKTGSMRLASLASQPWNYPPSLSAGIGSGDVITVVYKTNGGSGADTVTIYGVNENATFTSLGPINVTAGSLIHLIVEVSFSNPNYTISAWINGIAAGGSTPGATTNPVPIYGMFLGSCQPFSGLATTANYVLGQVAYYSWGLPLQRILAHYNTGITADSGDLVLQRLGKLGQWSGLGLPLLGSVSSPNPIIGNADQIQGTALADAVYALSVDEGGMYYAQSDSVGSLWYSSRTSLFNRSPRFTFGDNPGECPYDFGSGFDYSDAYLFNIISSQRTISASQQLFIGSGGQAESAQFNSYGVTAVTENQASEAEFLPRGPMSLPIETTSDQDAYDRANWTLTKYQLPQLRANQIRIDPSSNTAVWPVALGVGQGDVVTVNRRPVGGATISLNCIVQQVEHNIGPGVWQTTITLAPYFPDNAVIQLDNTSFNQLQDGVLGW